MVVVVGFQVAVALGAPWGEWTQGGGTVGALSPSGRAVAVVSAVLLAVMALTLLARVGQGPLARAPRRLVAVLAWATVVYLAMGVVANLATPSVQERALWAPLVALLLLLALATVLGSRRRAESAAAPVPADG